MIYSHPCLSHEGVLRCTHQIHTMNPLRLSEDMLYASALDPEWSSGPIDLEEAQHLCKFGSLDGFVGEGESVGFKESGSEETEGSCGSSTRAASDGSVGTLLNSVDALNGPKSSRYRL